MNKLYKIVYEIMNKPTYDIYMITKTKILVKEGKTLLLGKLFFVTNKR